MGIFAMRLRGVPTADPEASASHVDQVRSGLPPRFEAVGEALASGSGSADACAVAGIQMAKDGASLDETLEGLAVTYRLVVGIDPAYDDVRAVARSWSDTTLAYLHQLACEDPMTGLASLAHVRSRLSELYRGGSDSRLGCVRRTPWWWPSCPRTGTSTRPTGSAPSTCSPGPCA